ncbi:hypothetical protein PIB30_089703 [Stylosanthes scabra]|uniref:Uncharacterized protein n=1 Tax=Stylosanthes scabra TaxID=79078 RepID=A0ABU6TW20_9FABA|nr:hypothetical protein [Stylosanthes scabra]
MKSLLSFEHPSSLIELGKDESQEETSSIKREGKAHNTTNTEVPKTSRDTTIPTAKLTQIRAQTEKAFGKPKTAKAKKTTRISVKPVRQRFSQRIIVKGGPSRPKPKKVEVINLSSDNEADIRSRETAEEQPVMVADPNPGKLEEEEKDPDYEEEEEEEDPEESVEAEEIPSSWSLLAPSTTASERRDDEYDDPHYWNYDGDLDDWGTDVGEGDHDVEPAPAEGSEGSCPSPSSSAD